MSWGECQVGTLGLVRVTNRSFLRRYIDLARVEEERANECVGRYDAFLRRLGVLTNELAAGVKAEAEAAMRAGIAAAEATPPPDPELLFSNAYVNPPAGYRDG